MTEPVYFGHLMPEREAQLEVLKDRLRPHVGDLAVGESVGIRLAMTREGLKLIIEPKRIEVML